MTKRNAFCKNVVVNIAATGIMNENLPSLVQRHLLVVVWIAMFSLAPVQDSFATNAYEQSIAMMLNRLCSMV